MSRLVKPTEYAKEQNISRQAVYAKIKKGLLESKMVEGKIYIIAEEERVDDKLVATNNSSVVEMEKLLESKDETISVLKASIEDLKHTNTEINSTLRGEIELLKQVFTEMRNLYVKQVTYSDKSSVEIIESQEDIESEESWIELDDFFKQMEISKDKKKRKLEKRFKKAYKRNDKRVKIENSIIFLNSFESYTDILE